MPEQHGGSRPFDVALLERYVSSAAVLIEPGQSVGPINSPIPAPEPHPDGRTARARPGRHIKAVQQDDQAAVLSQNLIDRGPMIEIQQAAKPLAPLHSAVLISRVRRSPEQHIAKTLVVPSP